MGFKGTPWSKTQYYRRQKKAQELGCSIHDLPDNRGKNPKAKGSDHHRWNKGKMVSSHGYTKLRVGTNHPLADPNGYVYEHLLVWVSAGKPAPGPDETIHHRNEDKTDNRLDNLELKPRYHHSVEHHSTLSDAQVRQLRESYANGEADMPNLAQRYEIPVQRVSKLIRGDTRVKAGGPILKGDKRQGRKP